MKPTRRAIQLAFLALVLMGVFVLRGNAERWCPLGGVEALYTYLDEGNMVCSLGISNFYILGGVLLMTLLVRRAFCGYACPIGTISECLHAETRRVGLPTVRVPHWLDRTLAGLKYVVLALIVYVTWQAGELMFRGYDPCYALIGRHGEDIKLWAYVVAGTILVGSLLFMMPFCRWFCPLAAVLNPFSRIGLARVRRDEGACLGCRQCAEACPMAIPVDQLREVTAARCITCMSCMDSCPEKQGGAITWGPPRLLGKRWPRWAAVGVLLACVSGAVAMSYAWPLPSFIKSRGEPPDDPRHVASVDLEVEGLTCRGRANLLFGFLTRADVLYGLPGYLKLEAWPGPGAAAVRISFDRREGITELMIKRALTEPYFDPGTRRSYQSRFVVVGYDPLGPDALQGVLPLAGREPPNDSTSADHATPGEPLTDAPDLGPLEGPIDLGFPGAGEEAPLPF